jgi:hypothetical protein
MPRKFYSEVIAHLALIKIDSKLYQLNKHLDVNKILFVEKIIDLSVHWFFKTDLQLNLNKFIEKVVTNLLF